MPTRAPEPTEQRLRRMAARRGLTLIKAYGEDAWFLHDRTARADTARVLYSLADVEAALNEGAPGTGPGATHTDEG